MIVKGSPAFYYVRKEVVEFPVEKMPRMREILQAVRENEAVKLKVVDCALVTTRDESWAEAAAQ